MLPSDLVQQCHFVTISVHACLAKVGFDHNLVLRESVMRLEKHVGRTISLSGLGFRTGFLLFRSHDRLKASLLPQRFTVLQSPHLIGQPRHSNVVSIVSSPVAIAVLCMKPIVASCGTCERRSSHSKQPLVLGGVTEQAHLAREILVESKGIRVCVCYDRYGPHIGALEEVR